MKSTLKKFLSITLVVSMLMSMCTFAFAAFDNQVMNGYYVLDENGNVTGTTTTSTVEQDGFKLDKTICQTGKDAFDITLKVVTSQTVTTNDAAVMLVIDTSNSMNNTRLGNVKETLKGFLDELKSNAAPGAKVYVSVVKFSSGAAKVADWLDITDTRNNSRNLTTVKTAISNLGRDGGTDLDAGLLLAKNRLNMNDIATVAPENRYTIVLTDGKPTYYYKDHSVTSTESLPSGYANEGGNGSDVSADTVNKATESAGEVKENSTLYTVFYGSDNDSFSFETKETLDECKHCGKTEVQHYAVSTRFGTLYYCDRNHDWWDNTFEAKTNTITTTSTLSNFLANNIATDPTKAYAFNDSQVAALKDAFKNIADASTAGTTGSGTKVVDPMGQYITLGTIEGKDGVSASGSTLTWMLDPSKAEKSEKTVDVNKVTTYTYTVTYPVTLNTAAEGFQEKNEDGSDKYYPTNGYTYLEVPQEGAAANKIAFNVPGVKGEIPEYPYTVKYYLQNTDGTYTLDDTVTHKEQKLYSAISFSDDEKAAADKKYNPDHYTFFKAEGASEISENVENNVISVYYNLIPTDVTVNHYYKLTGFKADGTKIDRDWPATPDLTVNGTAAIESGELFVGQTVTAKQEPAGMGDAYTYALNTKKTGSTSKVLSEDGNVIDLYYELNVDERADTSVKVERVFRDYAYELVNGEYKEKLVQTSKPNEIYSSSEEKAHTQFSVPAEFMLDEVSGYAFNADDTDETTITLSEDAAENVITLYYDKHVDNKATVTVKHHYEKTVEYYDENGVKQTETKEYDGEADVVKTLVGETVELAQFVKPGYQNDKYTAKSDNPTAITAKEAANEVTLNYTLFVPAETTNVTVKHIFQTKTETTVPDTDADGKVIGTKTETSTKTDATDTVTVTEQPVGSLFTVTEFNPNNREGYEKVSPAADYTNIRVLPDGRTEIEIYYLKDAKADKRDDASIQVTHIYETRTLQVLADGTVGYGAPVEDDRYDVTTDGQVGDTFQAESDLTIQGTYIGNEQYRVNTDKTAQNWNAERILQNGENASITIYYIKDAEDLTYADYKATYKYYTYYEKVDENTNETYIDEKSPVEEDSKEDFTKGENDIVYVGQSVEVPTGTKDGYTPSRNETETKKLEAAENTWNYEYSRVKYLPEYDVTVKHHYITYTVQDDGSLLKTEDKYSPENPTAAQVKEGLSFQAKAVKDTYEVTGLSVNGEAQNAADEISVKITGNTEIEFTYEKVLGEKVEYTVEHHYYDYDVYTKTTSENENAAYSVSGSSRAGYAYPAQTNEKAGYALTNVTYNDKTVDGFDAEKPAQAYLVTLADGSNKIVFTYVHEFDSRNDKGVSVKVIHNYFARDTYVDKSESKEEFIKNANREYFTEMVITGKENNVWIEDGHVYTAELAETYTTPAGETVKYEFVNADPAISVELNEAGEYTITINYLREYSTDPGDTSYVVTHVYCRNGVEETRVTGTPIVGKVGSVVNASDIGKITENNGRTYRFVSASPESITLEKDVVGELILTYNRTTGGGGGGGGGGGYTPTPKPDPIPEPPVDDEEIVDEDVPLAALPVPGDEELEDFEEEEVPLANVPKTSDMALFWLASSALSGIGLGALNLKKREDEDEQ